MFIDFAVSTVYSEERFLVFYGKERLGQGRENAKQYLREHPEIIQEVEQKVKQKYNLLKSEPEEEKKSKSKKEA